MTAIYEQLLELTGVVKVALRAFAWTMVKNSVGIGICIAAIGYLIAADGSILRGLFAAVPIFLVVVVSGGLLAFHVAVAAAATHTVSTLGIGQQMSTMLLSCLTTSLQQADAESRGFTRDELSAKLHELAPKYFSADLKPGHRRRFFQWLTSRIEKFLIKMTIRTIVAQGFKHVAPGQRLGIEGINRQVSQMIDDQIVERIMRFSKRQTRIVSWLQVVTFLVLAFGTRQIPIP